ncbi:MAG: lamin tail domain-containing protein, partial [Phycisphaerales bacterium]|nr:lamin tail domain-containing protein [Phycisphaerales bacterium]
MCICRQLARSLSLAIVVIGLCQTARAQTGACCTQDTGVCSTTTASACAAPSIFYGVGTACTPNACQGACCSNATPSVCTVVSANACTTTFLGVGTTCAGGPCATITGACCTTSGVCNAGVTPASCTGANIFRGVGSTCSPGLCTASVGPCCSTRGVCTLTLPSACALPSTFGVVGNACSPNPCTIPTGACCAADGTCAVKNASGSGAAACGGTSGDTYIGNGTTCSPNPCAALVGACCQVAGTCVNRTSTGCGATPGQTFNGVGSLCAPSPCITGACCSGSAACTVTVASGCTGTSTFLGNGTTCGASPCAALTGACCANGSSACTTTTANGCLASSFHTFNGVGTTCGANPCTAQLGACCRGTNTNQAPANSSGSCSITVSLGCNGAFQGAGTSCTPSPTPCAPLLGACCNGAGNCLLTMGAGCSGANSFRGVGTTCFPSPCGVLQGACCNAAGFCTITTAGGCTVSNTFQGAGTICAPDPCPALQGACCSTLGQCAITTAAGCAGPSAFAGAGTSCTPNNCVASIGACCDLDTGGCTQTTALGCAGANVTWAGGTACNPGNPCAQPSGACCIGTFCTAPELASNCGVVGGLFFFGQTCSPTPCVRELVVISQVYPGGGTTGGVYTHDYVELYNRGTTDVTMNNWSIQFGAQSTQTFPQRAVFSGTIQAGRYFLIRLSSSDPTSGSPIPVTPDWIATESVNLDVTAGRLALISNPNQLPNGCPAPLPVNMVDFVGYGNATGANVPTCSEGGSPAGGLGGNIYAYYRKANGCQDTDNNGLDFTQPLPPSPRNSSFAYTCGSTTQGACCSGVTCSVAADAASCVGVFYGEGTSCAPIDPCQAPQGACCSGASCSLTLQGACVSPSVYFFGRTCSPDPCTGACCSGSTCTSTSIVACMSPSYFLAGLACSPAPCATPTLVQSGDIAYGASVTQNQDSVQQIRGAGSATPTRVGTWTRFDSMQVMRFDNHAGVLHNAAGNLLGMNFGSQATGGSIANLPTTSGDASAGETLFEFTGSNAPFGLQRTRTGGMSVSPSNNRIAFIGFDSARLYVLSYNPGATVGTGAGAMIDGGAQTDNNTFVFGFNVTQGTTWLDNDTIIMWIQSDVSSVLKLYTVSVSGAGAGISLGTPVEQLAIFDNKPNSSRFTSIAYNPQLVPGYLFLGSSAFSGISLNTMYVVDVGSPAWALVKTVDHTTSLQTQREISIGPDRNLYLCQFAGTGTVATDPLIDMLVLDADANGTVTAAEVAGLADNSTTNFYLKGNANTVSFNSIDIALSRGACCEGAVCSLQPPNFCTGSGRAYLGDNSACSPGACQGACCCGSNCSLTTAAVCSGANQAFSGAGTVCTPFSFTVPCCRGNYNKSAPGPGAPGGVSVQDIFDFLAGY